MLQMLPITGITGVALSGGVDSMVLYYFLRRTREVTPYFYHHGTETSEKALTFLLDIDDIRANLAVGRLIDPPPKGASKEAYWRKHRYNWLNQQPGLIATAHHLDDVAETWIMSCLRGNPRLINYQIGNVLRPLLPCTKSAILEAADKWNVPWIEDETNKDVSYMRNRVRHRIMPEATLAYPGFYRMLRERVIAATAAKEMSNG